MKKLLMLSFLLFVVATQINLFSQNYIFWGDYVNGNVYRSDLTGENIIIIATGQYQVRQVAVDQENFRVYWAVGTQGVKSANFDGSDVNVILNYGVNIGNIEFDYLNDRIFFTENFLGTIKSCNLDGTDIQLLVSGTGFSQGISVDGGRHYIFWGDQDSGNIYRANTDGTEIVTVLDTETAIFDVELDVKLMKIYFSDRTDDDIKVMDYNGENLQTLVYSDGVMGSMSIDFDREKMYWIERENGLIREVNLNGTGISNVIYQAGSQIGGLDVSQSYIIADAEVPELSSIDLKIYPNPCKDLFYTNFRDDAEISVYNGTGQVVLKTFAKAGEPVNVSELKDGIYLVVIRDKELTFSEKLIIQND